MRIIGACRIETINIHACPAEREVILSKNDLTIDNMVVLQYNDVNFDTKEAHHALEFENTTKKGSSH